LVRGGAKPQSFSQLRKQRRDRSRRKTALKGQRTPKNSEAATLTRGGFR